MAFVKGQSGNPEGRQPNKPFLDALNRAIKQDDGKKLRAAADKVLELAEQGEQWAIQFLADRTDGKPSQQIEQTTKHEGAIAMAHAPAPELTKEEWLKAFCR